MTEKIQVVFGESNPNWDSEPELNRMFLQLVEQRFNHRLSTVGYVFLNEVLETMGFEIVREGTCGGWVTSGNPAYVDVRAVTNTGAGTTTITLVYQENILDDVWPQKDGGS